jgi:hypothetical protein
LYEPHGYGFQDEEYQQAVNQALDMEDMNRTLERIIKEQKGGSHVDTTERYH